MARRGPKAIQVPQGRWGPQALADRRAPRVKWARSACADRRVKPDLRACRGLLAKKAKRAPRVLQVRWAKKATPVLPGRAALRVSRAIRGLLVPAACPRSCASVRNPTAAIAATAETESMSARTIMTMESCHQARLMTPAISVTARAARRVAREIRALPGKPDRRDKWARRVPRAKPGRQAQAP